MESPTTVGHVTGVLIIEPATSPEPWTFARFRDLLLARLDRLGPFTERLVEVPLGLDFPYWVQDPNFDIDYHLRHVAVPGEKNREQFADLVARIHARPLDRRRPLWESYVVDGLPEDRKGIITKVHHAAIDGMSGVELLAALVDLEPIADVGPPAELPKADGDELPSRSDLMTRTATNLIASPKRVARAAQVLAQTVPVVGDVFTNASVHARGDEGTAELIRRFGTAPRTPFNKTIGPHRRWSYISVPLAEVKAIKDAAGTKVNDAVLGIISGVLRKWLIANDALPDRPLAAMCPVSVRKEGDSSIGNSISSVVTTLATHIEDPHDRLKIIQTSMDTAKEKNDILPADILTDLTQVTPPAVAALASRFIASTKLADRMTLPFNLVVSNVPAPPIPLYLAGALIVRNYPVSAIVDGVGLNVTVMTTNDMLDFGFVADRDLIPDLWSMADAVPEVMAELADAVGVPKKKPAPKKNPAPKKPAAKKEPAAKKKPAPKKPAAKKS